MHGALCLRLPRGRVLVTASEASEGVYQWVPEEARRTWVRRNRNAFDQVRAALRGAPELPPEWPCESLHARFLDAVVGLTDGTSAAADVAALGAAVIRRNSFEPTPRGALVPCRIGFCEQLAQRQRVGERQSAHLPCGRLGGLNVAAMNRALEAPVCRALARHLVMPRGRRLTATLPGVTRPKVWPNVD